MLAAVYRYTASAATYNYMHATLFAKHSLEIVQVAVWYYVRTKDKFLVVLIITVAL